MNVDEIARFLARYPPFTSLSRDELEDVASVAAIRPYEDGQDALVEDGRLATHFFVVRSGAMELVHVDEVIDILEPGEAFGHPSLLTGMAPAFTVRAHGDAVCYAIPKERALRLLGNPAGTTFVARTLRDRLVRTGHTVHALPEVRTLRVASLLNRPPVFLDAEATIREAVQAMRARASPAVLIRTRAGLGIVTDADLRDKVLGEEVSLDRPVDSVMTTPVVTIDSDRLAVESAIEMLQAGIQHLPVLALSGEILGVLSAADLMNLENLSPFALRRSIASASDEEGLVDAASHLPRVFVALLDAGLPATDVGRVLSLQSDSVTERLIDLTIERRGPPPVQWAWLALGSVARRELTLASDQDNALAYEDSQDRSEVDSYFKQFAEDVTSGLARCGFGADKAEVLARNHEWRMSRSEWLAVFASCLETPDRSHLVRAAVSFDFRHVTGGLDIVPPLVASIRRAPEHPDFLGRVARTATDIRPPLGFRRRLMGEFDVKKGGVVPLVNLARFHALSHGVTISPTLDRLIAVEELGALGTDTARGLREAFAILCKVRLEHHAAQIEAGRAPDNLIDPLELPPLARIDVQEALRAIIVAQKMLGHFMRPGM
ncbi:MAG: CBS domain-containing protein [Actinobacteria bacterium]|nr:CBS domain-containing protein [Actinomycetota bacterium]